MRASLLVSMENEHHYLIFWVDQMNETWKNQLFLRRGSLFERELCLVLCNFTVICAPKLSYSYSADKLYLIYRWIVGFTKP